MTRQVEIEQQAFIVDGTLAERFVEACRARGLLAPRVIEHLIDQRLQAWEYEGAAKKGKVCPNCHSNIWVYGHTPGCSAVHKPIEDPLKSQ